MLRTMKEDHDPDPVLGAPEASQLIANNYALRPTSVRLIAHGVNDTYTVVADGRRYAFRIYGQDKPWIRNTDDLRFELDLLTHLSKLRAPVSPPPPPPPPEQRDGDTLGTWQSPTGTRHYALFSWCPGRPINIEALTHEEGVRLGAALAAIHVGADTFATPHSRYSLDAETLLNHSLERMRPALAQADSEVADLIESTAIQVGDQLRDFSRGPARWGIIHADPQVLNCHYTDHGTVGIFDFDLCGFGWRTYDIAYCLRHTGPIGDPRAESIRSAVLAGYEKVRPLSDAEHQMLPILGPSGLDTRERHRRLRTATEQTCAATAKPVRAMGRACRQHLRVNAPRTLSGGL